MLQAFKFGKYISFSILEYWNVWGCYQCDWPLRYDQETQIDYDWLDSAGHYPGCYLWSFIYQTS